MCVIIHAKTKKHVNRSEIQEAMRNNNAGFYMALLRKQGTPKRESIRTMDQQELLKFFDEKVADTDEVVMHARIPSYGARGLENVHGWEVDGIQFCHNMSIHSIDGFRTQFTEWKDKTDSQFFFEKLFIPYYRSLGDQAYKDGKLHDDLDKFVKWICGTTNKFCFIMPDNVVLRYGNWVNEPDRKEDGKIAFYASNTTYKVYKPVWDTQKKGEMAAKAATFHRYDDFDYDYDYDYGYFQDYDYDFPPTKKSSTAVPQITTGEVVRKCIGHRELAKAALRDLVLSNIVSLKTMELKELGYSNFFESHRPEFWDYSDIYESVISFLPDCEDGKVTTIITALDDYAEAIEDAIRAVLNETYTDFLPEITCKHLFNKHVKEQEELAIMLNVFWNFSELKLNRFIAAFEMSRTQTGVPAMEKIDMVDIIVPEENTIKQMTAAVENLLLFINSDDQDIQRSLEEERITP